MSFETIIQLFALNHYYIILNNYRGLDQFNFRKIMHYLILRVYKTLIIISEKYFLTRLYLI